jgi:pimeloyl-ACP methyl ester carboxylesterase
MWVPESGLASSYRASIYYEAYGEGPCVLFIPGGFETHLAYWKNVPAFVQAGYRVITTNLRGHFQSPCAPQDLDFRHHARDIEAVLDREGIARAALVGWSMGGFGALRFAVERPHRVAALVLMGSTAGVYSPDNYGTNCKAVDKVRGWTGVEAQRFDVRSGSDAFLRRQLQMLHSADGSLPGPTAMLDAMVDRRSWLEPAALHGFRTPTLIVGGDHDALLGGGFQRHVAELIPGAELSQLQDTGHNPHWEAPERFNTTTIAWLQSRGWPSAPTPKGAALP